MNGLGHSLTICGDQGTFEGVTLTMDGSAFHALDRIVGARMGG